MKTIAKTLSTIFTAAILMTGLTATAQDKIITEKELPARAQAFIKQHFSGIAVTRAVEDKEFFGSDYKAYLSNGVEIDFDDKGDWEEVENKTGAIPAALVPKTISTYLSKNYKGQKVTQIDKSRGGYEIKLANNIELEFDAKGNFVRIDD